MKMMIKRLEEKNYDDDETCPKLANLEKARYNISLIYQDDEEVQNNDDDM